MNEHKKQSGMYKNRYCIGRLSRNIKHYTYKLVVMAYKLVVMAYKVILRVFLAFS